MATSVYTKFHQTLMLFFLHLQLKICQRTLRTWNLEWNVCQLNEVYEYVGIYIQMSSRSESLYKTNLLLIEVCYLRSISYSIPLD